MTRRIIPWPTNAHREIQSLLPWYVAGDLEALETAKVQEHLNQCAGCQTDVREERRLAAEIAALPLGAGALGVEHGWALIGRRIAEESRPRLTVTARMERFFARRPKTTRPNALEIQWLRGAVAVQFCLLLAMGAAVLGIAQQPAPYHTLGAAPASAKGDIVVIFRPETQEKDLRAILKANDARLVDGPTVADAYVLHVPGAGRAAALARLRRETQVLLAEPIDAG